MNSHYVCRLIILWAHRRPLTLGLVSLLIPTILLHRQPILIALPGVCRVVYCGQTLQEACNVYRSRTGMWCRHFDLYHFRPLDPPQPSNEGVHFEREIMAKRWQIEHSFVLRGIGQSCVGFRLVQVLAVKLITILNASSPQMGGIKIAIFGGWIIRTFHLRPTKSVGKVPQFVGFSC